MLGPAWLLEHTEAPNESKRGLRDCRRRFPACDLQHRALCFLTLPIGRMSTWRSAAWSKGRQEFQRFITEDSRGRAPGGGQRVFPATASLAPRGRPVAWGRPGCFLIDCVADAGPRVSGAIQSALGQGGQGGLTKRRRRLRRDPDGARLGSATGVFSKRWHRSRSGGPRSLGIGDRGKPSRRRPAPSSGGLRSARGVWGRPRASARWPLLPGARRP